MKIKLNPDQEIVRTIREGLKRTGGYCPCRVERTEETKCMCKEFKDQIADPNYEGRTERNDGTGHLQAENRKLQNTRPFFFQQAGRVAYCALAKNTVYW